MYLAYLIIFLAVLLFFIFPAGALLGDWFLQTDSSPAISVSLGLLVVTLEAYLLGLSHLYPLTLPLIVLQAIIIWRYFHRRHLFVSLLSPRRLSLVGAGFVLLSVFINSLQLFPFGAVTSKGISLYGAHFVDSTWHLSLINSLSRSVPPPNPLYSGLLVTNYHYLVDLQIALIHNLTRIPVPVLYFQIIGPFYLLLLSLLIYRFSVSLSGRALTGVMALCFIMLSSNWYYFARLVFPLASVTPSVAWVEFFTTKTVNYPLLVSLILLFVVLEIIRTRPSLSLAQALVLGFLTGSIFGIKSHTAVVLVAALGFVALLNLFRKNFYWPLVFVVSLITVFIFSQLVISSPAGGLQFSPLWFIKVMYESTDHLNFPTWELRRQTLLALGSYLGIVRLYFQGLSWFLFLNFGPLLLGVVALLDKKLDRNIKTVLLGLFLFGLLATFLFIYTATAIVTIQFVYLSLVAASILTAYFLSRFSRFVAVFAFVVIWLSLLPGTASLTAQYLNWSKSYSVSPALTAALVFLTKLPPGTILTDDTFSAGSFVPAYSGDTVYLGDHQILTSLGIDYSDRKKYPVSCIKPPYSIAYILARSPVLDCQAPIFDLNGVYIYLASNSPHSRLP